MNFHRAEKERKAAYRAILTTSQIKIAPHIKPERKIGEKAFFGGIDIILRMVQNAYSEP